jgi:hypothetical protein
MSVIVSPHIIWFAIRIKKENIDTNTHIQKPKYTQMVLE